MMQIFDTQNYKTFVNQWVSARPKVGRGEYRRIALHLRISSVLVSLIFKGDRDLTIEQGLELGRYLRLSQIENTYFLLMIQHSRAGTHALRQYFAGEMEKISRDSQELKNRVPAKAELDEAAKAIYYSDWHYSAIRLLTSIPGYGKADAIAGRLNLDPEKIQHALDFLIKHGLCEMSKGLVKMRTLHIHLSKDSPYIKNRQVSWRLKAMEGMAQVKDEELFFTGPVAIARDDLARFRADITKFIEDWLSSVQQSSAEDLACLNIDWFRI